MDFVHAHQRECGLAPCCRPALQVTQIDRAHGTGRHSESPRYLPSRGTLTRLADSILKALAERGFAGELGDLLGRDPAIRTAHSINLDDHRGPEFHARQIAHFPLADIVRVLPLPAASRTDQLPMAPLPPNPQLQCLRLLMDLVPVHPIPRPCQQFGEFVISQLPSLPKSSKRRNSRLLAVHQIPAQSQFNIARYLRIDDSPRSSAVLLSHRPP